jgi:hypothetical protein
MTIASHTGETHLKSFISASQFAGSRPPGITTAGIMYMRSAGQDDLHSRVGHCRSFRCTTIHAWIDR